MTEADGRTKPPVRIGVAVVHGIGDQSADFAEPFVVALREAFARMVPRAPSDALVFGPVHWAPVLDEAQRRLGERVGLRDDLDWRWLRRVMISFVGDGIAYEPTLHDRRTYDAIHGVMADSLHALAAEAGGSAPLCVVAHSLGSVIASNYMYDLGKPELLSDTVKAHMTDAPLERGETFTHFFTLGSPLAIWALHHDDFGRPLTVPSRRLASHHPTLTGSWLNFFDRDDVIAYPLQGLNEVYAKAVTEDVAVSAGGWLAGQTPLSHTGYLSDGAVVNRIAAVLADTWRAMGQTT